MLFSPQLLSRCGNLDVESFDAIGDRHHDANVSRLYLEESVALLVVEPVAAVTLC